MIGLEDLEPFFCVFLFLSSLVIDERHGKLIETAEVPNTHRRNNINHRNKYLAIKKRIFKQSHNTDRKSELSRKCLR